MNLDPNRESDKTILDLISNRGMKRILHEITTSRINQLDHIFVDESYNDYFCTSYNNHSSDHKTITVRIPLGNSKISEDFRQKFYFKVSFLYLSNDDFDGHAKDF